MASFRRVHEDVIVERISLRDAAPADIPFLARLYHSARRQEVEAWGWPPQQQEWFLNMQFQAQSRSYRSAFPHAADRIVCLRDEPVGRMLVSREPASIRLIDIALLEEHRSRGIGSQLIRRLVEEAQTQHCPLHLQVLRGNPAIRLYRRLGFVQSSADPLYIQMEWASSVPQERS